MFSLHSSNFFLTLRLLPSPIFPSRSPSAAPGVSSRHPTFYKYTRTGRATLTREPDGPQNKQVSTNERKRVLKTRKWGALNLMSAEAHTGINNSICLRLGSEVDVFSKYSGFAEQKHINSCSSLLYNESSMSHFGDSASHWVITVTCLSTITHCTTTLHVLTMHPCSVRQCGLQCQLH